MISYRVAQPGQALVMCLSTDTKPASDNCIHLLETDTANRYKPDGNGGWSLIDAGAGAHTHPIGEVVNLQTALNGKEPANANIQAHVASAHAPSNAQKNSDITKGEIEAKLTGEISSHTHAGGGSDPFIFKGALANNASTAANTTPISLTGLVFTFLPNSDYFIDIAGATQAPAATTGGGFHLDTSVAVTRVGMSHVHQLANTGTLTGGSSIADDASVGVASGRPSANVDTPIIGSGYLRSGANGGAAQLRYRSEVAAVSTVMAGFMMRVMKV